MSNILDGKGDVCKMLLDVICFSLPNKNIEINLLYIYELKKEKLGLGIHNKDIGLKDLLLTLFPFYCAKY